MRNTFFTTLLAVMLALSLTLGITTQQAYASAMSRPTTVVIIGTFQSELGCSTDWSPDCAATALFYDAVGGVWQRTLALPAGNWEYKAALNQSMDQIYGQNAQENGADITLTLAEAGTVKFYFDPKTHWVTSSRNGVIANVPGSFQHQLGCSWDWEPGCLRTWLQDPDGNQIYDFITDRILAGNYEAKVALNESWDTNYGEDGVQSGANISFAVQNSCDPTRFAYDAATHVLDIQSNPVTITQPASVTIVGSFQHHVGCVLDWDPACAATRLVYDAEDDVWQGSFMFPFAGYYEYKVALNGSWDENYGENAGYWGANINISIPNDNTTVKFYYSHATHWVTDNINDPIYTVSGGFQSELGCAGDYQPACLRSWLQDPDGDGMYSLTSNKFPAQTELVKVAVHESLATYYGAGGAQNGSNIQFSVAENCTPTTLQFNGGTHLLTAQTTNNAPQPGIAIETRVNGEDADAAPGPDLTAGAAISWTYGITNTGEVALTGVSVANDQGLVVTCPKAALQAGEFMTCAASGSAQAGGHSHLGSVTGNPPTGSPVTASDPAHYNGLAFNAAPVSNPGGPYLGAINTVIAFDGSLSTDPDSDTLSYAWDFNDGSTGEGAMPTHSYSTPQIYTVCLAVSDGMDASSPDCTMAVVYDPNGGFVTGGGWINSPAGAYLLDPALSGKATFGFVSKYLKGASVPTGNTEFVFQAGGFSFHSTSYNWLVVDRAGKNAQFKGSGTVNGALDPDGQAYKFMLWAGDGTGTDCADTFRIKIWWEDATGEHVVYDNGASQPTGGGSIVVRTGK
jgi:hypothetical protein